MSGFFKSVRWKILSSLFDGFFSGFLIGIVVMAVVFVDVFKSPMPASVIIISLVAVSFSVGLFVWGIRRALSQIDNR